MPKANSRYEYRSFHRMGQGRRPETMELKIAIKVSGSEIMEAMAWQLAHPDHPLASESAEICAIGLLQHRQRIIDKRVEAARTKTKGTTIA